VGVLSRGGGGSILLKTLSWRLVGQIARRLSGESYLNEISNATGVQRSNVRWLLSCGGPPPFSSQRRLTPLRTTSQRVNSVHVCCRICRGLAVNVLHWPFVPRRCVYWITECFGRTRVRREAWIRTLLCLCTSATEKEVATAPQRAAFLHGDCPSPSGGIHLLWEELRCVSSQERSRRRSGDSVCTRDTQPTPVCGKPPQAAVDSLLT